MFAMIKIYQLLKMKNKISNDDNIKVILSIYNLKNILKGENHEIKGQNQDL